MENTITNSQLFANNATAKFNAKLQNHRAIALSATLAAMALWVTMFLQVEVTAEAAVASQSESTFFTNDTTRPVTTNNVVKGNYACGNPELTEADIF